MDFADEIDGPFKNCKVMEFYVRVTVISINSLLAVQHWLQYNITPIILQGLGRV